MKCVRGVDGVFSFFFLLTQALYETGNQWVGTEINYSRWRRKYRRTVRRTEYHKQSPLSTTGIPVLTNQKRGSVPYTESIRDITTMNPCPETLQ